MQQVKLQCEKCNPSTELMSGLDFMWFELTEKCNLECTHCYMNASPRLPLLGAIQPEKWMSLIEEGSSLGCRKIQFIGGEATIYPALPELINCASNQGFEYIEVFTNGVSFSKELKKTFVDSNVCLAFSFYSNDPVIHDKVTKLPGSQTKTLKNMKWALAQGLDVRANVVRTPDNEHSADETVAFLSQLGIIGVQNNKTLRAGRGADFVKGQAIKDKLCGFCWRGTLCITASGQVYPCPISRDKMVGHVRDGLGAIVNSEPLSAFRQATYEYFSVLEATTSCTDPCTCTCTCVCLCECTCMCVKHH